MLSGRRAARERIDRGSRLGLKIRKQRSRSLLSANFSITERRKLSIKTANLDQHGTLQMRTSASRSQAPNNTAARKRAPATRSTFERVDWHRVDQRLDGEL